MDELEMPPALSNRRGGHSAAMLPVLAGLLLISLVARPVSADNVCGHMLTPRLQLLANTQSTDTFIHMVGGGGYAIVVYPQNFVYQTDVSTDLGIGVTGLQIPIASTTYCGQAAPEAVAALNNAMQLLHIGFQTDCFLDNPNLLKPSANEYWIRWFGRGGRTNQFRISSSASFPPCPAEAQALIDAIQGLSNNITILQEIDVRFPPE